MKYFFPDSHDLVDPSFDFKTELRSNERVRHQHDKYAHEVYDTPPYSGLLLSKAIVDGTEKGAGKYTTAQRQRLLRTGVQDFFRLKGRSLETMGDCGAFAYAGERTPPYSVDEVIDFYVQCGFDYGVSVDHVILAYFADESDEKSAEPSAIEGYKERQSLTLQLARNFLKMQKRRRATFVPIGVAQGWSPKSYAKAVATLQRMGYAYIGLGGLVPLKTDDILGVLKRVEEVRSSKTRLHLFGVSRCDHLDRFSRFGVASFDSTSPLLQAFKHDRQNYYTPSFRYSALRVPQVDGNAKLGGLIAAGKINQKEARRLEQACLKGLLEYDFGRRSITSVLGWLREYDLLHDGRKDRTEDYRRTLSEKPWKECSCSMCKELGIHIVIFRGAERNRRRGFHNLFVIYNQFHSVGARKRRMSQAGTRSRKSS